uniref:Magnesium transporter n=1 Tax=Physcomitrium patens TaxID=3218 RepID=A0A7I4DQV7_PHYPA
MEFSWNCAAGVLQVRSVGLHATVCHGIWHRLECRIKHLNIGLGETHSLASYLHRKTMMLTADYRNCSFRFVWNSGILTSIRRIGKESSKSQQQFGNNRGSSVVHNRFIYPGYLNPGWSQRIPFTLTHAQKNDSSNSYDSQNSSSSPERPHFDSEDDTECVEPRGGKHIFQDIGRYTDGEETCRDQWQEMRNYVEPPGFRNADALRGYKVSRIGSNGSDLFREDRNSVWPDEERYEDDDNDDEQGSSEDSENSASYESWGEELVSSIVSESVGSMSGSTADSLVTGVKKLVYQVLEVHPDGDVVQREVSRRKLLRSIAGLRLRDIRSVDPSLWVTNSAPAILVRDQAILLNLSSLRAIATSRSVLIFEHKSIEAEAFMAALLPRLRNANNGQGPNMPFELEVVEAALLSRTQRLEQMLMEVDPKVELAAKAGALRQMILEMLEHPEDIRKMAIIGRTCNIRRIDGSIQCTIPSEKQNAEDEEEEIEMLLEYYLISSRRLEVSRLELLLQVATLCSTLGALIAGIFGMNLNSDLEDYEMAFYITAAGIVFGCIALFFVMFTYLKDRKIL